MMHLGFMALFALLVSAVFGALMRHTLAEQVRTGARIFGGLVLGAWVAGWILFGWFG